MPNVQPSVPVSFHANEELPKLRRTEVFTTPGSFLNPGSRLHQKPLLPSPAPPRQHARLQRHLKTAHAPARATAPEIRPPRSGPRCGRACAAAGAGFRVELASDGAEGGRRGVAAASGRVRRAVGRSPWSRGVSWSRSGARRDPSTATGVRCLACRPRPLARRRLLPNASSPLSPWVRSLTPPRTV